MTAQRQNDEERRVGVVSLLAKLPGAAAAVAADLLDLSRRLGPAAVDAVLVEAGYHGVSGVLDPIVTGTADLPSVVREQASRRLAVEELWQAHLMRELEGAARMLDAAGIRACALKGPALGARVYAPRFLRHCMDVDLLVAPGDFRLACSALEAGGYRPEQGLTVDYLLEYGHHLGFSREHGAPLELHFRTYAGFGVNVPAEALLSRAGAYALPQGGVLLVPSIEDELVYLAAHAAGHSFVRLVWLFDIKLLAQSAPVDWDTVASRARAAGVSNAVGFALRLCNEWLDARLPLPRALIGGGVRRQLAQRLLGEASRMQRRSARENFEGLVFTSLLCDRARSTGWMLQHHVRRATRRRLKRLAPAYLPDTWSA